MKFSVCSELSKAGVKVVFLTIKGINNSAISSEISEKADSFYKVFSSSYSLKELSLDKKLIGYRILHKELDVGSKSLTPSPESLIKIILKNNKLRSINFIVDAYNYVSVKNKVSIGAHDLNKIQGNVRLSFVNDEATFVPLGGKVSQKVSKNDYCYVDSKNNVICHLECKQSELTKTTKSTSDCLFVLQGNRGHSEEELLNTAEELELLISIQAKNLYSTDVKLC